MKKLTFVTLTITLLIALSGCMSSKITTTVFDEDGKIEKVVVSEVDTNALVEGVLNLQNKIVLVIKDNLEIELVVTVDAENPVPHGKIRFNNGIVCVATIPKDLDPKLMKEITEFVKALKFTGEVSFKGIKAQ